MPPRDRSEPLVWDRASADALLPRERRMEACGCGRRGTWVQCIGGAKCPADTLRGRASSDTLRSGWRVLAMVEMKRRAFVKTAAGAGAGLLMGAPMRSLLADTPKPDPEVKRVLVMFKCHFDAGFVDTQAKVIRRYFTEYFPRASEVARAANAAGK